MSNQPYRGTTMVRPSCGRRCACLGDHAVYLLIQRDAAVQGGHNGASDRPANVPKVTRSSRSGSMFITERDLWLDPPCDGEQVSSRRRRHVAPGLCCGTTPDPGERRGRVHARDSRSVASCQDLGLVRRSRELRSHPACSAARWRSGRGGAHVVLIPDPPTSTTALIGEGLVESPGVPPAGAPPAAIRGRSLGQIAWTRLKRDKVAMAGGVVIVLLILVAIFAPLIVALSATRPTSSTRTGADRPDRRRRSQRHVRRHERGLPVRASSR